MTSLVTLTLDDAETAPTHGVPEPARCFELLREVELLKRGSQYQATGHAARTLYKSPSFRVVLIVLRSRAELKEHKTNHPVSIQLLEGAIRVAMPVRFVEPVACGLVVIEPGVRRDVTALTDSAFVLSLPWSEHDC